MHDSQGTEEDKMKTILGFNLALSLIETSITQTFQLKMNFSSNRRQSFEETFIEDLEQFVKRLEAYMRDFSPSFSMTESFWPPETPDLASAIAIIESYDSLLAQASLINASGDWTSFIHDAQQSFEGLGSSIERSNSNVPCSNVVIWIDERTMGLLIHLQECFESKSSQARLSLKTEHVVPFYVDLALSVIHLLIRVEEILPQDYAEILMPLGYGAADGAKDDINDEDAAADDAKDKVNEVANEEAEDDGQDDGGRHEKQEDKNDQGEVLKDNLDDRDDPDDLNTGTTCPSPENMDDEKHEDTSIKCGAQILHLRGGGGSSHLALSEGEERKLQDFPGLHRILRITELFDKYFHTYKPPYTPAPDWTQSVAAHLNISQDFYSRNENEERNESTRSLSMSQIALEQETGLIGNLWEELSSFVLEVRGSEGPYLRLKFLNAMLKILQQEDCNTTWDNESKRHERMRELHGLLMLALEDKFLDLKEHCEVFRKTCMNLTAAREENER
jgi:hypothetical protein